MEQRDDDFGIFSVVGGGGGQDIKRMGLCDSDKKKARLRGRTLRDESGITQAIR